MISRYLRTRHFPDTISWSFSWFTLNDNMGISKAFVIKESQSPRNDFGLLSTTNFKIQQNQSNISKSIVHHNFPINGYTWVCSIFVFGFPLFPAPQITEEFRTSCKSTMGGSSTAWNSPMGMVRNSLHRRGKSWKNPWIGKDKTFHSSEKWTLEITQPFLVYKKRKKM